MKVSRLIGLLFLTISQLVVHPLPAAEGQESLVDLFSMDRGDMITAPEHLGIINGKLTIGTPGGRASRIDGLWAPPFVSSDFVLYLELFGKEVSTPICKWWPFKMEQRGSAEGVDVTATTVLASGQRAGLVAIVLSNTGLIRIEVPMSFKTRGTLDRRDLWEFAQAKSATATRTAIEDGMLFLSAGERSIVLRASHNALTWDVGNGTGTHTQVLQPGGTATVYLAFAIGPTAEAADACKAIAAEPEKTITDADLMHARKVEALFQRIPRLVSANKSVEKFYYRSLVHLILNRWDVPDFVLHPYYSTGSIRGGCVTEYLWNYGESWEMMPLYDPAAQREHIKQFLKCDMTSHFAFNPIDGKAHGPWYMVNQEKIIGLVYQYLKITGDSGFLQEIVGGKTVLEHVLKNALVLDDVSKPVELINYGPSNSHLELRRNLNGYNHVMPDLNGRRYANYLHVAQLAEIAGKPAPHLRDRAAALKVLLKQRLWNSQMRWFDFVNHKSQAEIRWTVQMFYLLGGGVLDQDTEAGLISHLNEKEFLGEYGLHSLSKGDLLYDPADVDNGGPGACTSFPPNIALLLCRAGHAREAEDIMSRCLWWGSRMPYWGDSIYADRVDYRHDTPLQCTIDGVAGAQFFVFGMFGINPQFDGTILISPKPMAFAPHAALRGIKMRGAVFDVEIKDQTFKVVSEGKTTTAPIGRTLSIRKHGPSTEAVINIR